MAFSDTTKNAPFMQSKPESRAPVSHATGRNSMDALKSMGNSIFDQLLGNSRETTSPEHKIKRYEAPKSKKPIEVKQVFSFQQEQEARMVKELVHEIKHEMKMLQKADSSLMQEVKDIEKLTLSSAETQPGIYHVRFMEIVLQVIKTLRAKVNESRTWLHAAAGRGKKRGSIGMGHKNNSQYEDATVLTPQ